MCIVKGLDAGTVVLNATWICILALVAEPLLSTERLVVVVVTEATSKVRDAQTEYVEAVSAAQADLAKEMADSFQTMRDRIQRAWYRYQVRTGQTAPVPVTQQKGMHDDRQEHGTRTGSRRQANQSATDRR